MSEINSNLVPTFHDLSFYSNSELNKSRYEKINHSFKKNYNDVPSFYSRSPGRVNLMGDHIDYCYFSVLPMAIDNDVIIGVSENNEQIGGLNTIKLSNTNENYKSETITLPNDGSIITIDKLNFSWVNYFKCGLIVAHKFIIENYPHLIKNNSLIGLNLLFDGTVPTGGGLSSSAAICVASTLAILRANGITDISKHDLTKITVVSEHYVGVNTGGMDQCASIYGGKNKALLVQFKPKLVGIPFELPILKPNDMVFLISNSLIESNKVETAPTNYNLRAVEAAISAEYLASKFNLNLVADSNLSTGTLRGFLDEYFEKIKGDDKWDGQDLDIGIKRLTELLKIIETPEIFTEDEKIGFKVDEAATSLKITSQIFTTKFLSKFPVKFDKLKIYQRTKHIFGDSLRVLQSLKLIENPTDGEFLTKFGKLMNESQNSCNILNNASTPGLEKICNIAINNGSYGSRVTGAGFGGSVVHLTTTDKLDDLISALTKQYYNVELPNLTTEQLNEAIVVSKPATGSCIVELN